MTFNQKSLGFIKILQYQPLLTKTFTRLDKNRSLLYSWFHENGSYILHFFNETYLTIPLIGWEPFSETRGK